jgi:hypothetical protein
MSSYEVMLDLETLSTKPGAVILVIGAIKFRRNDKLNENIDMKSLENLDTFYRRITIKSCIDVGLSIEKETEKWWNEQDEEVKYEALTNPDRVSIKQALREFNVWFGNDSRTKIWGNGSSFDCGILAEAYRKCDMEPCWKFWLERDLRTIMDIGRVRPSDLPQYQKHHALFDCYRQIIGFQRSIKNIFKF